MAETGSKKRIDWIDCSKGIAIILVIIGHTIWGTPRGLIFSFHMPLFFILSAVTYKASSNIEQFVANTKRAFRHLCVPVLIMFAINVVLDVINQFSQFTSFTYVGAFIRDHLLTLLYSSCVPVYFDNFVIGHLGIIYFFVALFVGRTIYDFLQMSLPTTACYISVIILAAIGVFVGPVMYLPFCLDIALAVLPFFVIGTHFSKIDVEHKPLLKMIFGLLVWGGVLVILHVLGYSYIEIAVRKYPLFPSFYIYATAGTIFVCSFCVLLCKLPVLAKPFIIIGQNSLLLLCIHYYDSYFFEPFARIYLANDYMHAIVRVCANVIILLALRAITRLIIRIKSKP